MSAIERAIAAVSPSWAAKRAAARANLERAKLAESRMRGFNAVSKGRRAGDDWTGVGEGAPTESANDLAELRKRAREMGRNNPYWLAGKRTIVGEAVGHGIRATAISTNKATQKRVQTAWDDWAKTKACDVTGQLDFYGIQKLVMGTVVSDGECLVVRRQRGAALQLQVLGAEFLSSAKDGPLPGGGEVVGGVETDDFGAPVAYHVYKRHPSRGIAETVRIEARDVAHVFRVDRANQMRGESWIAPVFTRLNDWDDYEDADLLRQKVAACFGAIYTGVEAEGDYETHEKLEPGMIEYLPGGSDVKLISPPASQGLRDSALITHRAIAAGLGITYEALTGDYERVNFSSARMGHLRMARNVSDWQQDVLIERLLDRVWKWFIDATTLRPVSDGGEAVPANVGVLWTVPSRTLLDPDKETTADIKRVRAGFAAWQDVVRENGRDPDQVADAIEQDIQRFDARGLVLDVDARKVSVFGQGAVNIAPDKVAGNENSDDDAAA